MRYVQSALLYLPSPGTLKTKHFSVDDALEPKQLNSFLTENGKQKNQRKIIK